MTPYNTAISQHECNDKRIILVLFIHKCIDERTNLPG